MPSEINNLGKILLVVGGVLVLMGLFILGARNVPWLGRLPGDFVVQRKNFTFYFPLATSVIVSIVLSLIFYLLGRK